MIDYEKTVLDLIRPIVDDKDSVSVKVLSTLNENEILLHIYANSEDVARLIGRRGIMASSIRQMMSIASRKERKIITIKFESYQDALHPFLVKGECMDKVRVGVIVNTHALKGELKVKSFSDFDEKRFAKGSELLILLNLN